MCGLCTWKKSLTVAFCEIFRITFHSTTQKHYSRDKIVQFRLHEMSKFSYNHAAFLSEFLSYGTKKLRVDAILYVLIYQLGVQRASHGEREMRSKEWSMEKWIMATLLVSLSRMKSFLLAECSHLAQQATISWKKILVIY